MSIRKRTWKTAKGEAKEAWVVDYVDQGGKRRLKTFERKKEASAFAATATVEIKHGLHTPESESPTVSEAAAAWISDCDNLERATLVKLSRLSTPMVCDFRDKLRSGEPAPGESEGRVRSPVLIRKVMTSLGSLIGHAKERGKFAGANPVRELGKSKRGVHRRRGEKRQKGRLQVGRDIPSP
jgi:integrase